MKNKTFSLINIFGLSIGLCTAILIGLWVFDEYSYDQFHDKKDRIYKVVSEIEMNTNTITTSNTPIPLAEVLKEEIPEVEKVIRASNPRNSLFKYKDEKIEELGIYADPEILEIFDFNFLNGNEKQLLNDPHSIILSEKLATLLFSEQNPIGKTLTVGDWSYYTEYTVTGVFEDLPDQSSLEFEYIMPYEIYLQHRPWHNKWDLYNDEVYVLLKDAESFKSAKSKISHLIMDRHDELQTTSYLYPFKNIYLYSEFSKGIHAAGKIIYVRLFTVIGIIIILIACINFMNLSTAKATKRAVEVGIRKTTGADRKDLISQFLIESIFTVIISTLIALTLAHTLLPLFNQFTEKSIQIPFGNVYFILITLAICLFTGIAAGIYPALYLSAFKPTKVLKGVTTSKNSLVGIRSMLVIVQFSLSIIFIISTIFAYNQINFVMNKDLGASRDNILYHDLNSIMGHKEAYSNEILSIPGVKNMTLSTASTMEIGSTTVEVAWRDKEEGTNVSFEVIQTDQNFIKTFDIDIEEGNDFPNNYDSANVKYIINEEAAKTMGMDNPIGEKLNLWRVEGTIVGVTNNFHSKSLLNKIGPVIIYYNPENAWRSFIAIDHTKIQETISSIETIYNKYDTNYPFIYDFVDADYKKMYGNISRVGQLSGFFALIAILVSCLGLFGLSAFMTVQRSKELGIRKVFGASILQLIAIFGKQMLVLLAVSFTISIPVCWIIVNQWLNRFEYKINMGFTPFFIGGFCVIALALITVSYNTIKASLANPIDTLSQP